MERAYRLREQTIDPDRALHRRQRMASLNSSGTETLLGVAAETVDRARESVKALVAVPLGVVVPMPEGGDE